MKHRFFWIVFLVLVSAVFASLTDIKIHGMQIINLSLSYFFALAAAFIYGYTEKEVERKVKQ